MRTTYISQENGACRKFSALSASFWAIYINWRTHLIEKESYQKYGSLFLLFSMRWRNIINAKNYDILNKVIIKTPWTPSIECYPLATIHPFTYITIFYYINCNKPAIVKCKFVKWNFWQIFQIVDNISIYKFGCIILSYN